MRACWSRMLAKVAEQHTIWPPLGHSDTALARSMTGPVYSLLLVNSCTCKTQHADTPHNAAEGTATPRASDVLRNLVLTSGQNCKSGRCCVSRGRKLRWWCDELHEKQGIHHSIESRTCTFSIMPVPMPILTRRPLNRTSDAARWTARSALSTTLVEVLMEERWWPMSSVGQGAVSSACWVALHCHAGS